MTTTKFIDPATVAQLHDLAREAAEIRAKVQILCAKAEPLIQEFYDAASLEREARGRKVDPYEEIAEASGARALFDALYGMADDLHPLTH